MNRNHLNRFESLLKAAFRCEPIGWPVSASKEDQLQFLTLTFEHGIQPLLYYHLHQSKSLSLWPESITDVLKRETQRQAIFEIQFQAELQQVLRRFREANLPVILLKGTPLAYTHYPQPHLRPRCDVDLFIAYHQLQPVHDVLTQLGYSVLEAVRGELISYQMLYLKDIGLGLRFSLDVHWKISNRQFFANCFSFEEAWQASIPVPMAGEEGRGLGPIHALVLACLHRVGHHQHEERLIWLYDLHVLATQLSESECQHLIQLATQKQVLAICMDGLSQARHWFNTKLPDVLGRLDFSLEFQREPSKAYLTTEIQSWKGLWLELQGLPVGQKLKFLKELAFPSARYMRVRYGISHDLLLPIFYGYRGWLGVKKLLIHK